MDISDFDVIKVFNFRYRNKEDRREYLRYCLNERTVEGYNMEFGVWKGISINMIANLLESEKVWGFDSFEGLPEEWITHDKHRPRVKGHFKNPVTKVGHFKTNIPDVHENVMLVPGWFSNTVSKWSKTHKDEISFMHIDCDLFSSTKDILEDLNDQIVPGTIICFDELGDWTHENPDMADPNGEPLYSTWEDGEWKAMQQWMTKYNRAAEPVARTNQFQACVKVTQ